MLIPMFSAPIMPDFKRTYSTTRTYCRSNGFCHLLRFENYVNQCSTSYNALYTFSGKEKDTETDYSYFGASYYSSDLSI